MEASSLKKYAAEALGTFTLTFFGCGSAAVAGAALGNLGIAFAFGLSIIAMAFVIGDVSGCHINPAVSLGLLLDKRLSQKEFIGYWFAQFAGAIVAAAALALVIDLADLGGVLATGLGCNGYGELSSTGSHRRGRRDRGGHPHLRLRPLGARIHRHEKTAPYAGIIIGLTLAFVHIMGIPLTGTSVQPRAQLRPRARDGPLR